ANSLSGFTVTASDSDAATATVTISKTARFGVAFNISAPAASDGQETRTLAAIATVTPLPALVNGKDWVISLTSGQDGKDKASDTVKVTGANEPYDTLFAQFTNSIAAGYPFLVKDTKLLIYRTDGAAFTVATFTADGTALPAATYADGAVLKVSGSPRFM